MRQKYLITNDLFKNNLNLFFNMLEINMLDVYFFHQAVQTESGCQGVYGN